MSIEFKRHLEECMSDTAEERAAFLRWWEGEAAWTGSPCAVAYAGWLARAALGPDVLVKGKEQPDAVALLRRVDAAVKLIPEGIEGHLEPLSDVIADVRSFLGPSEECAACFGTWEDHALQCPNRHLKTQPHAAGNGE